MSEICSPVTFCMLAGGKHSVKPYFGEDQSVRTVLPVRNDSTLHQTAHGLGRPVPGSNG
jgi:hypothetical protein